MERSGKAGESARRWPSAAAEEGAEVAELVGERGLQRGDRALVRGDGERVELGVGAAADGGGGRRAEGRRLPRERHVRRPAEDAVLRLAVGRLGVKVEHRVARQAQPQPQPHERLVEALGEQDDVVVGEGGRRRGVGRPADVIEDG